MADRSSDVENTAWQPPLCSAMARKAFDHPAVLSGPSKQPDRQFLNLPLEIKNEIYRALLVKDENVHLKCNYRPDSILWTRSLSVGNGVTALLRTCKRVEEEATNILYGENAFECYHARVFAKPFVDGHLRAPFPGISTKNAAKIKRAQFGLPLVIARSLQDDIDCNPFLNLLCAKLVGLQTLTIKTHMYSVAEAGGQRAQKDRYRALIATAARIAKYHPTLREAVWRRESGSALTGRPGELCADFYVNLMAPGFAPNLEDLGGSVTNLDAFGVGFESHDVLLNTAKIRATMFESGTNIWGDMANFRLPNNQLFTPVIQTEVTVWPGPVNYELLLDLGHPEQVATVEAHRYRYIKSHVTFGRFMNDVFVKGRWSTSPDGSARFDEGNDIPQRMIDGKWLPPSSSHVFVGGRWLTDSDFVEGKWVDSNFVRGVWTDFDADEFHEGKWMDGVFLRGQWSGEDFVVGKYIHGTFYRGSYMPNGTFVRETWGSWTKKPAIPKLSGVGK